jgi:hypothetical protein
VRRTLTFAAALPQNGGLPSWVRRTLVRMLAVESRALSGVERARLAAALALVASEEATAVVGRSVDRPGALPAEDSRRLVALLEDADAERAMFAAGLVAKTGGGGDAVVPALGRRAHQAPVSILNRLELQTDRGRLGAVQAILALGALARDSSIARAALADIPDEALREMARQVDFLDASAPWSEWLDRVPDEWRVEIALEAARAKSDDDRIVPLLKAGLSEPADARTPGPIAPGFEAFEWGSRRSRGWYADALGRLGPPALEAVPGLEALIEATKGRSVAPVLAAGALLRLRRASPESFALLVDAVRPGPSKHVENLGEAASAGLRSLAMETLADVGSQAAADAARPGIEDIVARSKDLRQRDVPFARHALRALTHATGEARAPAAALVARVLAAPLPHEDADGSARAILESGEEPDVAYQVRAAALDAIGELGSAAAPHTDAIRRFLTSPDERLRWRAARLLRHLGR